MSAGGPGTLPGALAATVAAHRDAPAVVEGDQVLDWRGLEGEARRFAAALCASGVAAGDRVALWAPNSSRWIVAALGTFGAGATLVPVNTRFRAAEAADILGRSGARVLATVTEFVGGDLLGALDAAGGPLPDLGHRVVLDGAVPPGATGWDDFCDRGSGHLAEADSRAASLAPRDVSDILFTSGTTGAPKGVVSTHGRTLRVAADWVEMTGLGPGDRYLMVNPYFHMFGLKAGILASVVAGATMYPEPTFDPDRALARIEAEGITVLPGPPTLYQSILDHPERDGRDLSSLRVAVTGAADIPVELIRRTTAELPFDSVITGYGLTEAGTATATAPADDPGTIATTVGRPRPGFELRIDDGHGNPAAPGEPGEVLLSGPSVMSHYLDDPAATDEALSADGWLATGDLGVLDDRGCLRIVGRSKDMFIVGGFNAYPAEIENMLLEHPAVAQVAVIGIPDDRLGEVGMAFVVRAGESHPADEGALVEWSRERMANYKAPRRFEFVDALPMNATGKVLKDDLRSRIT